MDRQMMVQQYVCVHHIRGTPWMVFRTGDDRYYLFSQCYPGTLTATGLQHPVRKSDLIPIVRRALAHGYGRTLAASLA